MGDRPEDAIRVDNLPRFGTIKLESDLKEVPMKKLISIAGAGLGVACFFVFQAAGLTTGPSKSNPAPAVKQAGPMDGIANLQNIRTKRASSWDKSGKNNDWLTIPPGGKASLLTESGAGCIRHFYWAYVEADEAKRLNMFRGVVLRIFWDGSDKPSVEVPLGDFFGVTNGQIRPIRSLAFVTNPGYYQETMRSWGFNCYLPMPFASGARFELENQGTVEALLWYHIDYALYESASAIPPDTGRFHALWHRENPTTAIPEVGEDKTDPNLTGKENYVILDVRGDGQLAGWFLTVVNKSRDWWGEGDDMIFIDDEPFPPSFHGTGTEEIFGGGACPPTEYSGPYTGFHCIENRSSYRWYGTTGAYRFYIQDPIRFRKAIRVTLEHGHADDLANGYATVAFWYQKGVNTSLPALAPISERAVDFQ
jgi:hypothetical protein